MKHLWEKVHESARSILEICLLLCTFFLPHFIDASKWIELCFKNTELNFDNIKYYLLFKLGNWVIGLLLTLYLIYTFRKKNKDRLFNTKNIYHDYSYLWYWFCSKILGYRKCNIKLVPIFMQFRLVLNDTFEEFYVGGEDDYPHKENEEIDIKKLNFEMISSEINFVLSDTYPINENQLPKTKNNLPTVMISRNKNDFNRYFSPSFIAGIVNEVRGLPPNFNAINIYATTNPKHTLRIAENAFKLADRGNIKRLVVFQQSKDGMRKFGEKGISIFK